MQKIAIRVFIVTSITFGILGILLVLVPSQDANYSQNTFFTILQKIFGVNVFIVLSSFALAVAGRFFTTKK